MSGYFGALMRSAGMGIGARAPALAQVEASVVEVDVERSPSALAPAAVPSASTPMPVNTSVAFADAVEPATPPAPPLNQRAARAIPAVQASLATPLQSDPGVAADAAADRPPSPPAASAVSAVSAAGPPKPPIGQALVRAAMQWVAADRLQASSVAQIVLPPVPPVAAVTSQVHPVTPAQQLRDADVEPEEQVPTAAPAHAAVPEEPGERDTAQTPSLAIGPVRRVPTAALQPLTPPARDEVVEVSIGAIHLRIEAPAAQTVARPAPVPPAAAPRAATLAPRSALSRRALRRI